MRKTTPHIVGILFITGLLWASILIPIQAQPAGWEGDANLWYLLEVNGRSSVDSNNANPIPVNLSDDISIRLTLDVKSNLSLRGSTFRMEYMGIPIINQPLPLVGDVLEGTYITPIDQSIPLGSLLGPGINLLSGTIRGVFTLTYSLFSSPATNVTTEADFVLHLGPIGSAAIVSVNGLITVGFTVMSIFSLLLALDEFQRGILAARKMRGAKRGSDVGIFPAAVVLRRKPKKGGETVDRDEFSRRVGKAAESAWDKKRCPKCGKKWKADAQTCSKCGIDNSEAMRHFSEGIGDLAPKAMKIVKPKSKVTVGKLSKQLRVKRDKGGAIAAALTDLGIFQTKSVKVPLKKVAFSGMTLAGVYWSWLQLLSGAIPTWADTLLFAAAGLVVSVLIGYFMNWLARVPALGYD
ncbi:MAG: zinc ribbon domain-containing protein [Candidatus Hodarchaeota archaeon]